MQAPKIAFLVYAPLRQRRADNSFDGNDNIGAAVVVDMLCRAGYKVGYVAPEDAHRVDFVLVSLTSTYDIYAFYRAVALLSTWQPGRRRFRVIAGGFGMQNPTAIRDYVDWAAFGRVDDWLIPAFGDLVRRGGGEHESLMDLRRMNPVTIAQASALYPHPVGRWRETFTGCPRKCKFCHYTWARRHLGGDDSYRAGQYVQSTLTGGGSPEVTWDQLLNWPAKAGRIRAAIDGSSYRLRRAYGKPITNEEIIEGIERIGSFRGTTTLLAYNIGNFPTETEEDRAEIDHVLAQAQPKYRVIVVLHTTPFRPSLATPMQWEAVDIGHDWSRKRMAVIVERPNLRAVHSFTLETPYSQMLSVLAERFTPAHDELLHHIVFGRVEKLRSDARLSCIAGHWSLEKLTAERDINGPSPAPFLSGYMPDETLRKVAHKMRRQARAV